MQCDCVIKTGPREFWRARITELSQCRVLIPVIKDCLVEVLERPESVPTF